MAAAFPPLDLGPLALVAPVPLLVAWSGTTPRRGALDGFVAGGAFFGVLVVWAWFAGLVAYVPLVGVLAASWALTGALVGLLSRRDAAGPLAVASAWTLVEALRGRWPLGGFSWGEVGYAFHDIPVVRTLAAWGGVLLVSLVAIAVAAWLARAWRAARAGERSGPALARCGAVLAVVAAAVVAAHGLLPGTEPSGSLRVAVLQGNDLNRDLTPEEVRERYLPVSHLALAQQLEPPLDLVVFPESSLDADPREDPVLEERLAETARRLDSSVLANASVEVEGGERLHNTNLFYGPDGSLRGTYVKQHLVPFGEYVPARGALGFLDEIEQVPVDYAPGDERRVFESGGARVANLICFESTFTEISRAYAREGAEVLVVSTNNRSFRRSANSAQHIAIGQMRAIETGRPLVHAAISGRSAFVEADGDVAAATGLFERTAVVREVTGRTGRTPYTVAGDWVVLAAAAILLVTGARARGRFARKPAAP